MDQIFNLLNFEGAREAMLVIETIGISSFSFGRRRSKSSKRDVLPTSHAESEWAYLSLTPTTDTLADVLEEFSAPGRLSSNSKHQEG